MSADKYPSIFSRQRATMVYLQSIKSFCLRAIGLNPSRDRIFPNKIFPSFQNCARCEKYLKDDNYNSVHLGRKYAQIFVLRHYLFLKAHSLHSRKTVHFSEQIMSADKYPSIFSRQIEAIVYLVLVHGKYPGG